MGRLRCPGWTDGMQACAYARGGAKNYGSNLRRYVDNLAQPPGGLQSRTVCQLAAAAGAEAAGAAAGAPGAAETVLPLASLESVR
ncbi:hypothetical protein NCCP2145_09150 [Pseudarthrobacter sp. NCCP-2145]|nr:hypothetical protein NCCP2145_09150 [Pseudarthrobacter sp. NCCP-2145]